MKSSHTETKIDKLSPGLYRIHRFFDLNGIRERKAVECHNPICGYRQLDEWQLALIERQRPPPAIESTASHD